MVLVAKNPSANSGEEGSIPGLGRSAGGGYSNPLQYSCLKNAMDRGAWRAAVHGVTKSLGRLKGLSTLAWIFTEQIFIRCLCAMPTDTRSCGTEQSDEGGERGKHGIIQGTDSMKGPLSVSGNPWTHPGHCQGWTVHLPGRGHLLFWFFL